MSANLDTSLGFEALAFTGPLSAIWHKTGNSVDAEEKRLDRKLTSAEWQELAGFFTVEKIPLYVGDSDKAYPDRFANVRTDTGSPLGIVSAQYQIVQPAEVAAWFEQFLSVDDRFQLTTMGALDSGKRIWAQAVFNGEQTVAGDQHRAKLLFSTTFDASGCSRLQGCMERVVCENTLGVAVGEHAPAINVRHSTKFDAQKASKELAAIADGFVKFKAMGDAMAQTILAKEQVSVFLRHVLDIPADAKPEDVSTRKRNQRQAIIDALLVSSLERGVSAKSGIDAFTALQAITRYVDHTRDANDTDSRLFGSGAKLKDKAQAYLKALLPV